MGKARLFGLLRDRSEITNLHSVMIDENAETLAERGRLIAAALAKCANQTEHDDCSLIGKFNLWSSKESCQGLFSAYS